MRQACKAGTSTVKNTGYGPCIINSNMQFHLRCQLHCTEMTLKENSDFILNLLYSKVPLICTCNKIHKTAER